LVDEVIGTGAQCIIASDLSSEERMDNLITRALFGFNCFSVCSHRFCLS
jgi:hypothetical protein